MHHGEEAPVQRWCRSLSTAARIVLAFVTVAAFLVTLAGLGSIGTHHARALHLHGRRLQGKQASVPVHTLDGAVNPNSITDDPQMPEIDVWSTTYRVEDLLKWLQQNSPSALVSKMQSRYADSKRQRQQRNKQRVKGRTGQGLTKLLQKSNYTGVPDKMIVVARADEDVSYLSIYLPDIPHTVYQAGWIPEDAYGGLLPEPKFRAQPQAKETNVYLQYIVSHYDKLPESIVFIHAHRNSWHMNDVVPVLKRLRWGEVGFSNLRYQGYMDWQCGHPWEANFPCGWEGAILTPQEPWGPYFGVQPQAYAAGRVGDMLGKYWNIFFEEELGPKPDVVYTQCCAEFIVHRDRIVAHPKAFYKRLLHIANGYDVTVMHELALAFEYAWHIIFGEAPVLAPTPECGLLVCPPQQNAVAA